MLIQIAQLFLSLMILVVLHELGHFIPAKLFKTRVEKFYLFFDPWFSLFKIKRGDTEYGIGWLPLGGYVKISGMIDESLDTNQMASEPQPWEFRAKKAWQRLIIMIGGITVNLILGVAIYAMVLFTWGKESLPVANLPYGIACDSLALKMGLQDGDKIVSVDGNPVTSLSRVPVDIIMERAKTMEVERNGEKVQIAISPDDLGYLVKAQKSFVFARIPSEVDSVVANGPADRAGLKKGDRIISVNDVETPFQHLVQRQIQNNKSKKVKLGVIRNSDTLSLESEVSEMGTIGFVANFEKYVKTETQTYSFFEAIPAGVREGYEKIVMQIKQFAVLFQVKGAYKSIGGFYTITQAFAPVWDWQSFWTFTAFFSIVLAFMNFLPIPALDGGHIMFLLYEMISGRKPSEKFLIYAQYVGMAILLALMIYANTDWLRK